MDKQHKVTREHFEQFVDYCKTFIAAFGLHDWQTVYFHSMPDPHDTALACVEIPTVQGKIAQIALNTVWPDKVTDERLRMTAAHEVLHLLLADITCTALYTEELASATRRALTTAEHAAINRLLPHILKAVQ